MIISHFFSSFFTQEREEDEKERREERAKFEKAKREERRAASIAKREAELRHIEAQGSFANEEIESESITTPEKAILQPSSSSEPSSTSHSTPTNIKKTTQAAADTSSDVEKKHKDKFVKEMSKTVVKILDPYRTKGVRGHIGNTDDFKHLAKKVT